MNTVTKEFIEELKARADVVGVVMFGSWARGNNRPDSDVDLLVILTEGYRRTVEFKDKQAFEIIYTTAKSALDFWQNKKDDCAGLWAVAKIVYDKDGAIQQLKQKAEEIIKEGKKPIDEYQKGQFKFSAEDELRAVEELIIKDLPTANLVMTYTVNNLTSQFFDLRQLWTPAPKQRLAKIKEIHPELGSLFENFYLEPSIEDRIEIAKKIIPFTFETNE
jgi:predicted nucleotidyltransferase